MCIRDEWYVVIEELKMRCSIRIVGPIFKFGKRFPSHELMNATMIIYPQYWLNFDANSTFPAHLTLLKA
jgi:hypothetical protein